MLRLVYCYAREDAHLVVELEKHLHLLKRHHRLLSWHPGEIVAGDEQDRVIAARIAEADVIVLLLSVDFFSSSPCYEDQLQQAMERHQAGQARVVPIRLRSADYTDAAFSSLQSIPRDGVAVMAHGDRDGAWAEVAREVRTAVGVASARRATQANMASEPRAASPEMQGAEATIRTTDPAHLPWLEARFHFSIDGWRVQLAPESGPIRGERSFRIPKRLEDTFAAIFDEDQDSDLVKRAWRLRLRPKDLDPEGELPPLPSWAHLYHPEDDSHLLDRGWTVTQLTVRPRRAECSGTIAVVGAEPLLHSLGKLLGPRVVRGSVDQIPPRSILVLQGAFELSETRTLQDRALHAECPLLIWCDTVEVPRSALSEVLTLKGAREPLTSWLVRFLGRLVSGIDPERAFSYAGLGGPPEDRTARWLRGGFSSWRVDAPDKGVALDARWFVRLDRSKQESDVNRLVHHLLLPRTRRRIQVIVTTGPEGSGLELFCHRPPLISPELPATPVVEWDLTWTENPAHQEQRLLQRLRARRAADLPERLLFEATRVHEQRTGTKGNRVLFWGRHETVSLDPAPHLRQVTVEDLEYYLAALLELSAQLARWDVRILLHLPFQGSSDMPLRALQRDEETLKINVLAPLPPGVPVDELRSWLSDAGLPHDEGTLADMMSLSYDHLIQWLVDRYPELRSL